MPRKKTVTLQTVARAMGLTAHTVSKALRGLPGMSETTRRKVVEKARQLGYVTKEQEAGLFAERIPSVSGKPRRFAMLMSGGFPYHRQQLEGVESRLAELGHSLYPLLIPSMRPVPEAVEAWMEDAGIWHTDGLFLTAGIPEAMESALLRLAMPKVLINYPPDRAEVDSVVWDVEYAVHKSMEALHARGHRRVLFVGAIEPLRGFRLRWSAFAAAAVREGMESADSEAHATGGTSDRERWMEELRLRLSSGRYTAVLSAIPGEAEWVYAAAASLGMRIPEDLSLVGMEHEELPRYPELSRPKLIVREAGERAAELMLRRIANPTLPYEHVRLKGPFLEGGTIRIIDN